MTKPNFIPINWEIEDGYAGGARPQRASICISELEDCCDETEVKELVEDTIKAAFENRVAPRWDDRDVQKIIDEWKVLRAATSAESKGEA